MVTSNEILQAAIRRTVAYYGDFPTSSGIYTFLRTDIDGTRWFYVGKTKNLLETIAKHLMPMYGLSDATSHIDASLKKRGFNENDWRSWRIVYVLIPEKTLDEKLIELYDQNISWGYKTYNPDFKRTPKPDSKNTSNKPTRKRRTTGKKSTHKRKSKNGGNNEFIKWAKEAITDIQDQVSTLAKKIK